MGAVSGHVRFARIDAVTEWLLIVLVGLILAAGIVGTFIPILPGLVLAWCGPLVYGLARGFGVGGWVVMIVSTALLALGTYWSIRIPQREARETGLTFGGQLLALAVGIVGAFIIPVFGLPFGFVLGVYLLRLRATGDSVAALDSTRLIMKALIKASGLQALCGVAIAFCWVVWAIARNVA